MKFLKNIATLLLVFAFLLSNVLYLPTFADNRKIVDGNRVVDMYAQGAEEVVNIDGVNYTYHYFYNDDGNRSISITDDAGFATDTLTYDKSSSKLYLNNEIFAIFETAPQSVASVNTRSASDWTSLGSGSHYISWARGATAAMVAAAIAIKLATLSSAGVIAAMGVGALGVLAGSAVGGTLSYRLEMFSSFFYVQYRYVWSFSAGTGDSYGPYYLHI
jgi:hypothetical protein